MSGSLDTPARTSRAARNNGCTYNPRRPRPGQRDEAVCFGVVARRFIVRGCDVPTTILDIPRRPYPQGCMVGRCREIALLGADFDFSPARRALPWGGTLRRMGDHH